MFLERGRQGIALESVKAEYSTIVKIRAALLPLFFFSKVHSRRSIELKKVSHYLINLESHGVQLNIGQRIYINGGLQLAVINMRL